MWHRSLAGRSAAQGDALAYAEAVLFVDDNQPELCELELVLNQRLGTDQDLGGTAGRRRVGVSALSGLDAACQQTDDGLSAQGSLELGACRLEPSAERGKVPL